MTLQQFNYFLFDVLNVSPESSTGLTRFAFFIAHDLFYFVICLFFIGWFLVSKNTKETMLRIFFVTILAFATSQLISHFIYSPRPFAIPMGMTLLEHKANGSFPSDHMLFFSSIAFGFLFSRYFKLAAIFFVFALSVAWSRIYLGVHFPLDMIGAFYLAFIINFLGVYVWKKIGTQIFVFIHSLYQRIFKHWIHRGWIR